MPIFKRTPPTYAAARTTVVAAYSTAVMRQERAIVATVSEFTEVAQAREDGDLAEAARRALVAFPEEEFADAEAAALRERLVTAPLIENLADFFGSAHNGYFEDSIAQFAREYRTGPDLSGTFTSLRKLRRLEGACFARLGRFMPDGVLETYLARVEILAQDDRDLEGFLEGALDGA